MLEIIAVLQLKDFGLSVAQWEQELLDYLQWFDEEILAISYAKI